MAFKLAKIEKYKHLLFAVIVENTFTGIPDMAKHLFTWLKRLPKWCYKNRVRSNYFIYLVVLILYRSRLDLPRFSLKHNLKFFTVALVTHFYFITVF